MATGSLSHKPMFILPPELRPLADNLVTEDNEPVDNFFAEKQHQLLVRSLISSWPGPGDG